MNYFYRKSISTLSHLAFTVGLFASPSFAEANYYNNFLKEHRLGLSSACRLSHWLFSEVSVGSSQGVGFFRFSETGPTDIFEFISVEGQKVLIESGVVGIDEITAIKRLQFALRELEAKKLFFVFENTPVSDGSNTSREFEISVFHLSDRYFHCEAMQGFDVLPD